MDTYPGAKIDNDHDQFMDPVEYLSEAFQRPYQYLARFDRREGFQDVNPLKSEGDMSDCLRILMQ